MDGDLVRGLRSREIDVVTARTDQIRRKMPDVVTLARENRGTGPIVAEPVQSRFQQSRGRSEARRPKAVNRKRRVDQSPSGSLT